MTQTLSQLENSGAFIERHIGPDAAQQQEMLNAVGAQSLNALTGQIVPKDIQLATPPQVGAPAPSSTGCSVPTAVCPKGLTI